MTTKTSVRRAPAAKDARNDLLVRLRETQTNILLIADEIDDIGEKGEALVGMHADLPRCPDQLACYASNCLQGVLALLRELAAALAAGPARRRGR